MASGAWLRVFGDDHSAEETEMNTTDVLSSVQEIGLGACGAARRSHQARIADELLREQAPSRGEANLA
jgi:hypothetical protein